MGNERQVDHARLIGYEKTTWHRRSGDKRRESVASKIVGHLGLSAFNR
jgi:hypothetical protein